MDNVRRSERLIRSLAERGVTEACVCAGSRNSPLLVVLAESELRLYSFFDERAAAFFAVGRIKLTGRPVAVVTTSGTAVAELLPATVEAFYSGLPLVLVSADRPARFRGTGAPQCVDQEGLFGPYAERDLDKWTARQPLHINIEFDEPLLDAEPERVTVSSSSTALEQPRVDPVPLDRFRRPLVILGGMAAHHRDRVLTFIRALGAPVWAEPLSGLREASGAPILRSSERILRLEDFDCVVRVGNVPTLRAWRDLEVAETPVVHFTDLPFAGLTRGEVHPLAALPDTVRRVEGDSELVERDRLQAQRIAAILDEEPDSEPGLVRTLSRQVPERARVYLGNSLPIREWDLAATREPKGLEFEGNRGANGIDGQMSTFFGQCDPQRDNICLLGDLTAMYDMNAPWIVRQLDPALRFRVVVINNGGGQIFARVRSLEVVDPDVRRRVIENAHDLDLSELGRMWGMPVEELRPDPDSTQRVWQKLDALWA